MTCMSMYKSTEIFIPVKVDEHFDICPFFAAFYFPDVAFPLATPPSWIRPLSPPGNALVGGRRQQRAGVV